MKKSYVLTFDQGTSSCRAIVFDNNAEIVGIEQKEFSQIYPKPGWVEHDPEEIFSVQLEVANRVLNKMNIAPEEIHCIGITNQRETTVLWDKNTGKPVYNAIVWQDTRTAEICENLKNEGLEEYIKKETGLIPDSYFSATKIKWIFDNIPDVRIKASKGEILFGTIDTWLLWKLTAGKSHFTDVSNASRTMIFNIIEQKWDKKLMSAMQIPESILPLVLDSSALFGNTEEALFNNAKIPITGVAGDQQASLFGQACFEAGMVKNTYGTGCFALMNTDSKPIFSKHGLLTTVAWRINNKIVYALEGSVFIAGAAIQWLRDGLKIIGHAEDSEKIAESSEKNAPVYFVPAFTGLGTPYWDMYAKGAIFGITRDTTEKEIIRAALDSIAYQTRDMLDAMKGDAGFEIPQLLVDGGACLNNYLMQFQADILNTKIFRPNITESTALGAAFLAGLFTNFWTMEDIKKLKKTEKIFIPEMMESKREELYNGWKNAVKRTLS